MNISQENQLSFKLTSDYHQIARNFAKQQSTVEKGKKVYLNTLAVCTVNTLLEEISFESLLDKSYSWDPIIRCFEDVADLVVADLGRVECLPIFEDTSVVNLPKEVRHGRIAYIVIQFQEVLNEAKLLGFYRCPNELIESKIIELSELEPIDNLIDYLFFLEREAEREIDLIEIATSWLESNDNIAVRIKKFCEKFKVKLNHQSYQEIIIQFLELIRSDIEEYERSDRGIDILEQFMGLSNNPVGLARDRATKNNTDTSSELRDVVEDLLKKLEELQSEEGF